jgi:hypothetical protein
MLLPESIVGAVEHSCAQDQDGSDGCHEVLNAALDEQIACLGGSRSPFRCECLKTGWTVIQTCYTYVPHFNDLIGSGFQSLYFDALHKCSLAF